MEETCCCHRWSHDRSTEFKRIQLRDLGERSPFSSYCVHSTGYEDDACRDTVGDCYADDGAEREDYAVVHYDRDVVEVVQKRIHLEGSRYFR